MPTNVSILDKQRLYTQLKHQLGAPIVGVELEDDMLDSLLDIAIQDYALPNRRLMHRTTFAATEAPA